MQPWIQYLEESEEETPIIQFPLFNKVSQTDYDNSAAWDHVKYTEGDTIILLERTPVVATTKTLERVDTSADYSTPSGKTSRALLVIRANASGTIFKVRSSAAADTADGTVVYDQTDPVATEIITVGPVDIAATQFVTLEVPAGDNIVVERCVIIEPA